MNFEDNEEVLSTTSSHCHEVSGWDSARADEGVPQVDPSRIDIHDSYIEICLLLE